MAVSQSTEHSNHVLFAPTRTVSAGSWVTALAGCLLALAGIVTLMGIITAEAAYPATYTTFENEISDLGATVPPNSIIRQPSARIFNATMLAAGGLLLASSVTNFVARNPRRMVIWVGLMGLGVFGVGVFPGDKAPYHGLFALLAFVSGGAGAIAAFWVTRGPFRYVSLTLGVVALGSLVAAFLGDVTPVVDHIGDGGIERWVAYPTVLWFLAYGGYLMGRGASHDEAAEPGENAPNLA